MSRKWILDRHVDDWVQSQLEKLGLVNQEDFHVQHDMTPYLREALRGSSKTKYKSKVLMDAGEPPGIPDLNITDYRALVLFENKVGLKNLKKASDEAINYARCAVDSGKYSESFAIGVAGNDEKNTKIVVYYVFDSVSEPKKIEVNSFDFLESKEIFDVFYEDAVLSEEEKHEFLIKSQKEIQKAADELSSLMVSHSIPASDRVIYVSGMLLSMQDVKDEHGIKIMNGLSPSDLEGVSVDRHRDGVKIVDQIQSYLAARKTPPRKMELMLGSFSRISIDDDRDKKIELRTEVAKHIDGNASVNKQIFCYLFYNVFLKIDGRRGHLDIIGEMYSEFLKYALGDGKELGIVLTPPYVTKMMGQLLSIDENSKVMDIATGSAAFLISAMELMIQDVESKYRKGTSKSSEKIEYLKKNQLLGIEYDHNMFTLASTNMILRNDGSSNIEKKSFNEAQDLYETFKPNRVLLNPPFSYTEKGMPFIKEGLRYLEEGGLGAIIVQDSAGSGEAINTNLEILKTNQLKASIKMPVDLFMPFASVQTSIYIFEHTNREHDYQTQVKFIDFRNDGYKRTERKIKEVDNPTQRYLDIIEIYKNGITANVSSDLWDLDTQVIMAQITNAGNDWNIEDHLKPSSPPTEDDFRVVVSDYINWEIKRICDRRIDLDKIKSLDSSYNERVLKQKVQWGKFRIGDFFDISPTKNYGLTDDQLRKTTGFVPVVTNTSTDNGIGHYVDLLPKESGNKITFSDTTKSSVTIFYQPDDFIGYSHVQGLTPKKYNDELDRETYLFIVAAFRKAVSDLFDYGTKFTKYAKDIVVRLPQISTKSDEKKPDFEYMRNYIRFLEKEHVMLLKRFLPTDADKSI